METFKQLAAYQYSSEAYIFKAKLESAGIEAFLKDHYTIDADPLISNAMGGVKLFVKAEDFIKAQAILAETEKYSLDDQGKPLVCPKCGSEKTGLFTTIKDFGSLVSFVFSALLVVLPFYNKYRYKCYDCGFEFTKP